MLSEVLEYYKNRVIEESKNKDILVLDIGTLSGDSIFCFKNLPKISVYAFEANPEAVKLLVDKQNEENVTNLSIFNGAFNNSIIKIVFKVPDNWELSTLAYNPSNFNSWKSYEVDSYYVDSVFRAYHMPIHYILCDANGSETIILKSAEYVINLYKPELFIRINDQNLIDCESNREELLKTIKEYNYTLVKELPGEFYHYIQSKD